MYFSLVITFR